MGLTVFDVMGHSAHTLPTNPHPNPHTTLTLTLTLTSSSNFQPTATWWSHTHYNVMAEVVPCP